MASQFGRAPLASPPFTDLVNGAALTRPLLRAPRNVRLDGTLSRSLSGARVTSPYSVGLLAPFAMVEGVAGAAFLLATAWDHLPEILIVENGAPPPGGTGQDAGSDGSAGDRRCCRLNKTGPEGPDKVVRAGDRGFMRSCAPPGTGQTASMVPAGGSSVKLV